MYRRRKQIGGYLGEGRRAGVRARDVTMKKESQRKI